MHESHTMQLSQPSENLKQYIPELAGLAVLLEVHPEIHLVPLQHKECGLIWELYSDKGDNMFALFILSLVQYLIFKVELLWEHKVLLESLVFISSYKAVSEFFASDVAFQINFMVSEANTFLDHGE